MTTDLPTYANEPCWCGAPSVLVQLTDHGHVMIAACATHRSALVLAVRSGTFVVEVARPKAATA